MSKFDEIYNKIITEARIRNERSFFHAKTKDNKPVMGKDASGQTVQWKIGPTDHNTVDVLTGEKLPKMSTILWLPNARGKDDGISVSYVSYTDAIANNDEKLIAKIEELGLPLDIDFENV